MVAKERTPTIGQIESVLSVYFGSSVEVIERTPIEIGACQQNESLIVRVHQKQRELLMLTDAMSLLPGSLHRANEFIIASLAQEMGVLTPKPFALSHGLVRPNAYTYFLPFIKGVSIGKQIVHGEKFRTVRSTLCNTLASELAKVHQINIHQCDELGFLSPSHDAQEAFKRAVFLLTEMSQTYALSYPAIALTLSYLQSQTTQFARPSCLTHGDFRIGNFLVSEEKLCAILDWEFAHISDPLEDLGWLSVRDWRFGNRHHPIGGVCDRNPFYEAYCQASGHRFSLREVLLWELVGNVRWALGCLAQGTRFIRESPRNLEHYAAAQRVSEIIFEMLLLTETLDSTHFSDRQYAPSH